MATIREIEEQLGALSPAEKAQLLQSVVRGLGGAFAGIESNPRVCGGDPCIVRTRIPVWVLEQSRRLGMAESEILASFPTLRAEDLVNAWAYAAAHREEIDRQIIEHENENT
ncbi:MAG: DUF433 domain-containing protein [Planctomycetales bacterium]